jgi:hypothetical protein
MRVRIRDWLWSVRYTPHAKRHYGWCDKEKREIVLSEGMRERKHLEIAIHEFEHAFDGDLDESVVRLKSKQLAAYLIKLRYRKQPQS